MEQPKTIKCDGSEYCVIQWVSPVVALCIKMQDVTEVSDAGKYNHLRGEIKLTLIRYVHESA